MTTFLHLSLCQDPLEELLVEEISISGVVPDYVVLNKEVGSNPEEDREHNKVVDTEPNQVVEGL